MGGFVLTESEYNAQLEYIKQLQTQIGITSNDLAKSALESELRATVENLYGSILGNNHVKTLSYEAYAQVAGEAMYALADTMPNMSDLVSEELESYKSGMQQLRELAGDANIDFYRQITDDTTFAELRDNLKELSTIDVSTSPEAASALENIKNIVSNEARIRLYLDSNDESTLHDIANMSKEQIVATFNLGDSEAEEFMQYVMNKEAELPLNVTISEESM